MAAVIFKNKEKEEAIIRAAEKVFFSVGYQNAKMEDIAKGCDFSKVTVYSYFTSKENLYMALTYKAIQHLIEILYECWEKNRNENGLEAFMILVENYLNFCIANKNYADLILNYLTIVRRTVAGEKLNKISEAMQNSVYYRKIRGIQNVPIDIAAEEIKRGQKDGSITQNKSPWVIHHMMWSMITGFVKVNYQPSEKTFIGADNEEWKNLLLETIRGICMDKV
ncbi:MAG: TetR/AcrR family transcriptional regulator [Saprospiraceae bacterium]